MRPSSKIIAVVFALLAIATAGVLYERNPTQEQPAGATTGAMTYAITADARGGDCDRLGNWDAATRTCVLSAAPGEGISIRIAGDDITLDGNDHVMHGTADVDAIRVYQKSGVTVQNLAISGYRDGVVLRETRSSTVRGLRVSGSARHGVYLNGSDFNVIESNRIGPTAFHGINLIEADGNQLIGNHVFETRDGVRLQSSVGNVVAENHFVDNRVEALDLHSSRRNRVFFNSYITREEIAVISDLDASANDYGIASGGSYYSAYDEPAEGCTDENEDGFCDRPFRFRGGEDERPFVREEGWLAIAETSLHRSLARREIEQHAGERTVDRPDEDLDRKAR